ncbi:hypothetical protein Q669_29445 [Labrenzia sp. C1B10]|uniref:tape measure protein n=1 Tax=unclassified Labrenzia TaxID=2648686 RepID=UPI0003B7F1A7|nr:MULTISPECIES: tape measure protein [unclassified Labrenzia]ERP95696.1 hypothetical protein Q669_29445 [Labrenzia sp. C1B10]ERS05762.1 hypothetical protein Q675_29010 [Labrenzia sp. C1B70]
MADKDVRLIIRAKDAASKTLDQITSSIDEFNKSASKVDSTAGKAGSVLSQLGDEFETLSREIKNISGLNKVASDLGKMEGAIGRLEGSLAKSAGKFKELTADVAKADAATSKLRTQSEELSKSLEGQKERTAALRKERAQANAELRKAESAYASVQKQIARQGGNGGRAAQSADAIFSANVDAARAAAQKASQAYDDQKNSQESVRDSLKKLNAELKEAERGQANLTKELERTSAATKESEAELSKARAELDQLQSSAKKAGAAIGQTSLEQDKLSKASEEVAADLNRVQDEMKAMERFSTGLGGFADPKTAAAIRQQRAEVEKARQEWKLLEAQTNRLRAAMNGTQGPTRAASDALRDSASASRQARLEYERQLATLQKFPAAVQNTTGLRGIFKPFYGESRQALSLAQRLRGEILSLATAYAGLYGTIQNVGGVITAYQTLEAAQNRLGSIFGQNEEAVGKELAFLERQAKRLGISFQTLAGDYSKFAVAASSANLETEATRKVFLSVAEAGRVNKLTTDQMSRTFKALEQILSKGKFTAEEVRQQLGEALPGAFFILADAIGVSGAELDKLLAEGKVFATQTNMLKFADALNARFGDQLAKSLTSTTTNLGRFQDALYQAQLRVAEGGFIEGLNEALEELDKWFRSREGRDFFLSIGAALGNFAKALAQVPPYIDVIILGVKALVALKVASWITENVTKFRELRVSARDVQLAFDGVGSRTTGLRTAFTSLRSSIVGSRTSLTAYRATLMSTVSSLSLAQVRASAFRGSLIALRAGLAGAATVARAFWVALGGPIGLIITGLTFITGELLGSWAAGVDDSTRALDEHSRILQSVVGAYEELGDKTEDWADSIKDVTLDQANANVRELRKELDKAVNAVAAKNIATFGTLFDDDAIAIRRLQDELGRGEISAKKFVKAVEEIYDATDNDAVRDVAEEVLALGRNAERMATHLGEGALAAISKGSAMEGLEEIVAETGVTLEGLTKASDEVSDSFSKAETSAQDYGETLNKIKEFIPELADEMKKLKELGKLDEIIQAGGVPKTVAELKEAMELIGRARQAINDQYTNYEAVYTSQRGTDTGKRNEELVRSTVKLAEQLGVSAKDLLTVFSYETAGTFDPDKRGQVTQHGLHQGLIQFGQPQAARFGYTPGQPIEEQMKAVGKYLTDAGVRAGDGLLQIYAAVNAGDVNKVNASDANNGGAPGTVLDKVNNQMGGHQKKAEGLLAAYGGTVEEAKKLVAEEKKLNEEKERGRQATADTIADKEFEIAQQGLLEAGKGRQAAIEEAIRAARAENKNISEEEVQRIAELTGKLYDQQNRLEGVKAAEAEVNRLYELRRNLMEQIEYYTGQGDTTRANQLKEQLNGVNTELDGAIQKAIAMWQAIGGPEADAAIAKLNSTKIQLADLGNTAFVTGEQMNQSLASGLTNALDRFAQAVANGENVLGSLRDAFLQFASEFLIEIGKMIVQQALLNALQAGGGAGGGVGGFLATAITSIFHDGTSSVGSGPTVTRSAPVSWFNNAKRYHGGGIAGLKPGEVPAILEEGEVVDPGDGSIASKVFGGLGGGDKQSKQPMNVRIVNAFDSGSVVSEGLATPSGEQTLLNVVKENPSGFRSALGID